MFPEIEFDQRGLVACIVQDFASGEVLMFAYMSPPSLEKTLEEGDLHFHSRSRDELWKKGEASGNFMHLRQLRYDCDVDALVALVDPAGPACHPRGPGLPLRRAQLLLRRGSRFRLAPKGLAAGRGRALPCQLRSAAGAGAYH